MLEQILNEINQAIEDSEIDLTSVNPKCYSAMEGKKRSAVDRLVELRKKYDNEAVKAMVIMTVDGKYAKKFADIAQKNFKVLAFDFANTATEIASNMAQRSSATSYGTSEHFLFMDELNKIKLKYGIQQLMTPSINFNTDISPQDGILGAVMKVISKTYSGSLYSIAIRKQILDAAYDKKFSGKILPIVIYNNVDAVDTWSLPAPVANFTADIDVDMDLVKEQILTVKDKIVNK